jgi:TM2 domain-containing membrane protein YozV
MMNAQQTNSYFSLPGVTAGELYLLQQATADLDDNQVREFRELYIVKRKNPQDILLLTLSGLLGIAGIHRIVLGETTMGVLYFFTYGFFGVMTIMDIVNNKTLTNDYNQKTMTETYHIVKMGR